MKSSKLSGVRQWLGYLSVAILAVAPGTTSQAATAKVEAPSSTALPQVAEETIGHKTFEVSHMIVNAPPERVWDILANFDNAPSIFENLKVCQLLEDRGTTKIVRHVIHPSGYPGTFDYTLEIKENAPRQMEWHRISGSFKEVDGYWKIDPLDGGRACSVSYRSYINGGFFLPQPLIRAQIRDDIPDVMASLKSHAEAAATQIARRPDNSGHRND